MAAEGQIGELPSNADLARVQGERAGRRGSDPEANPFDPDTPCGRAWEDARKRSGRHRAKSADHG